MSESRTKVANLLRTEMAQEASTGFPMLRRIPCTQVVRFLDYWSDLDSVARETLLDALAKFASVMAEPERAQAEATERQQDGALSRMNGALAFRGLAGGYRYTPIKILGGIGKDQADGGLEGWIRNNRFSPLELQRREDLLPDLACVEPIKPAKLKKLVDKSLADLFAPQKTAFGSEMSKYTGTYEGCGLTVDVLFAPSGRLNPRQLQYQTRVVLPNGVVSGGTYEGLWSLHNSWDFITEENGQRSVEVLRDLVVYLIQLVKRVNQQ